MKELENNEKFFMAGKELPFNVPDGYFDKLPTRIQHLCVSQPDSSPLTQPFFLVLRSQLALATGFVALVLLAFAGYFYLQPQVPVDILSNSDYIEIVRIDIAEYDEAILSSVSNEKSPCDSLKLDRTDEMIKYLLEENVDFVTLMEQYQP